MDATVPKAKKQERNKMLKIAFHLAFTAILRIGEVLG